MLRPAAPYLPAQPELALEPASLHDKKAAPQGLILGFGALLLLEEANHFFLGILGVGFVFRELHRELTYALGGRGQRGRVAEHFREGNQSLGGHI